MLEVLGFTVGCLVMIGAVLKVFFRRGSGSY